ncbi:MAG: histidine kinase [Eggerthellaceae bacterium]|nr:histidine kinase [Eggerthellaceae bacterium]
MFDKTRNEVRWLPHIRSFEIATAVIAVVAVMAVAWFLFASQAPLPVIAIAVLAFVTCIATIMRLLFDPDSVRARQTDLMLRISNAMVDLMAEGMTVEVAQRICEMLLPRTAAIAVAITDDTTILGYAGYKEMENPQGSAIRTQATHDTLEDGITRLLYTPAEIGFPDGSKLIKAAIIVPIEYGGNIVGTLKFYYRSSRRITETQKSIARGLGKLLSTEVAASKLEEQRELATSMELKMLQSQINPHFLFNTINTIASLIRTDPPKARELLREFAVFYRSTIEHSQDQIRLALELEQTLRYFSFEVARFGEDRLEMNVDLESKIENTSFNVAEMMVPPFLLQPIVENAVKHAMPAEGKLTIVISAQTEGSDVLISVTDDGVGMDSRACNNMMHSESSTGLGIAMKNVHDRMHGFFGSDADILVATKPGEGTQVTLRFPKVLETQG